MPLSQSKYWFVPRKNLFVPRGLTEYDGASLRRADSPVDPTIDQLVQTGNPFTILLKSFYVIEDRDKGDNDLLVRSWTKYGSDPHIEIVHFFKKDVPSPYFCKHDLVAEHMFALPDYQDENLVWIRLQILEVDGSKVSALSHIFEDEFQDLVDALGAIFPGTLPFIGAIATPALELFHSLRELVRNKNDLIFESSLDLCSEDSGETPFRYGVYVFFQQPTEGHQFRLSEYKVIPAAEHPQAQPPQYMVIEVVPEVMNSFKGEDILLNQNLAAGLVLSDTSNGQHSSQQDKRFQYLQALAKKASRLDDLAEYRRLKQQQKNGEILNEFQQQRLQVLTVELSEYLNDVQEILKD
jgi:hypothetical protein